MKTKGFLLRSGAGLGLALLLGLTFAAGQEKQTVSSGKQVYEKKCASCHGKEGEGVAKMSAMLKTKIGDVRGRKVTADTLTAWKKMTTDGKGKMPAFKTKLSGAEIDSSLAYLQLLAKASSGGAKTDSSKGTVK
ncbi:MAG: c-type cytochrome [Limisphaerales bacterium]